MTLQEEKLVIISAIIPDELYKRLVRRYKESKKCGALDKSTFEELVGKYLEIGVEAEKVLR